MSVQEQRKSEEVPLQITVPKHVKLELDVQAAQIGRTKRSIVLEALRTAGFEMTDAEVLGR